MKKNILYLFLLLSTSSLFAVEVKKILVKKVNLVLRAKHILENKFFKVILKQINSLDITLTI